MNKTSPPLYPMQPIQQIFSSERNRNEVPARIKAAMEFFTLVTAKTMERMAVNDVGFESIPGQKLTQDETDAHEAACQVLVRYFNGNLKMDSWEGLESRAVEEEINGRRKGRVLTCFACGASSNRPPSPSCEFCHGTGVILVTPIGSQE